MNTEDARKKTRVLFYLISSAISFFFEQQFAGGVFIALAFCIAVPFDLSEQREIQVFLRDGAKTWQMTILLNSDGTFSAPKEASRRLLKEVTGPKTWSRNVPGSPYFSKVDDVGYVILGETYRFGANEG